MTERQLGLITEALEYALDDMDISPEHYRELDRAITATLDILRYYNE